MNEKEQAILAELKEIRSAEIAQSLHACAFHFHTDGTHFLTAGFIPVQ